MKFYLPVLNAIEKASQDGLVEVAARVLHRSNELIPKDTGETAASGFATVNDLTAQVGYSSFIARLQHEDLDNQHPTGGQAKFLETAADEIRPQVGDILAKHIRGALDA